MAEKSRMDKAFERRGIFMIIEPEDIDKYLVEKYRYYPATDQVFDNIGYFKFVMFNDTTTRNDLVTAYNESAKFGNGFDINIDIIINVEPSIYERNKTLIDAFIDEHGLEPPYFIERRGRPQKKWDRDAITEDQMFAMLDKCDKERHRFMVMGLYYTGMRIGELIAMRPHWMRYKDGILIINIPREEGDFKTKTKAGERIIYVTDEKAIAVMRAWFKEHDGLGVCDVTAWKDCVSIAERAGIEQRVTPHILRHSGISRWAWDETIKPELLMKMAGHTDMSTTLKVYIHQFKDQVPESIRKNR